MIMQDTLLQYIESGESEILEFKPSLSQKDKIMESISAFSNTKGGTILIGIQDNGMISGVDTGTRTLEDLANYVKRNTDPPIFPSIEQYQNQGKNVIAIVVSESDDKPVFFHDKAYKRVGRSNHRIAAHEIRSLAKQERKTLLWDEKVCDNATHDDIDWNYVNNTFIPLYERISQKKIVSSVLDFLTAMRTIRNGQILNAGILLFGINPLSFFPSAYIALARYKGIAVGGEKLDLKEFKGNLFERIDACYSYLLQHTLLMSRLIPGNIQRTDIPEYGKFSLRELVTNAVCHRDYADQGGKIIIKIFNDRIEFSNIGGLMKGITPDNIEHNQYSRNPVITSVLSRVQYIEELGEGWDKIIEEHRTHPLKPAMPSINSTENSTMVTLYSTREQFLVENPLILSEREEKILEYIRVHRSISRTECMDLLAISKDTAIRDLNNLIENKLIKREGKGRSVRYVAN